VSRAASTWRVATAIGRSQLRRHWVSIVALGLLAGITSAVVFGALAVAVRTTTAPERLDAATNLDDARVTLFGGSDLEERITALPPVRDSWTTKNAVGLVEGEGRVYLSVTFGGDRPDDLFTPVMVDGRMPSDSATHEVAVSETLSDRLGVRPGDTLPLRMLLAEEVFRFDTGFGRPDGPLLDLEVTGVVRMSAAGGNGFGPVFAGPAFELRHADLSAGPTLLLRLEPGEESRAQLDAGLAAISDDLDRPINAFGPLVATYPADEAVPRVVTARRVLGGGLVVFAVVAAAAGLLTTVQASGRLAAAGAADQRTESAIGLVRAERVLGRVLPGGVAVVLAAALATVGVLAAGLIEPLGALAEYEPRTGWLPHTGLAALAAVVTAVVLVVVLAVTTARAGRPPRPRRSRTTAWLPRFLLRRAPAVAGASLAFGAGPDGGGARPSRATVAGAALGITGIIATLTFSASLARLDTTPERYGWNADFAVIDARPVDLARLDADPEVADVQLVGEAPVRIGDDFVYTQVIEDTKGALPTTLLEGSLPVGDRQVAVGPRTARNLGLDVGDTLTVGTVRIPMVVSGIVLPTPSFSGARLGTLLVLDEPAMTAVQESKPWYSALVRSADPAAADAVYARYAADYEVADKEPPPEVSNLLDLGRLPVVLAVFFGALAAAGIVHALLHVTRRRGRELGVLRALGFTRRQVSATLLFMACSVLGVGLVVGLPLGFLVGRLAWAGAASSTGVGTDVEVPVTALLLAIPVGLFVACVVALLPARRAGRLAPATLLRDE
jgi:putative ABC transport system permease protein